MYKSEPTTRLIKTQDHNTTMHLAPTIKDIASATVISPTSSIELASKDDTGVLEPLTTRGSCWFDEKENPSVTKSRHQQKRHHPIRTQSHSSALRNFCVNQKNPVHQQQHNQVSVCPTPLENRVARYPLAPRTTMAIPCEKSPKKARRRLCARRGSKDATRQKANKEFFHQTVHAELMRVAKGRFEDHQATIIQATFRGFRARRDETCFSSSRNKVKSASHRRNMSEITMSAFGDSIASIGSFTLSPQPIGNTYDVEDGYDEFDFLLNENSHTTFSTVFSNDSSDVPAKPPSRKLSPRKQDLVHHQLSPRPSPERSLNLESLAGLRLEPDNNKGGDEDDDSICLIPTLKPREEHDFSERGHLSLPSFFGRDLPAKLPRRSYSPIPSDSTNSGSRTRASSLDCGAKR